MITIFRHIRHGLLKQNKFSRYILYALGEILLVVIGILIALQVNNWNENRINNKKEHRYLSSLLRDLNGQVKLIDHKIEQEDLARAQVEHLLNEFKETRRIGFTEDNGGRFSALTNRATYVINNPTFTELLSTGNLELIGNQTLRNKIVVYYQNMELSRLIVQKNNDNKDDLLQASAMKLIDYHLQPDLLTKENKKEADKTLEKTPFSFPSLSGLAERLNEDEARSLELINILKIRWSISRATVKFLEVDRELTLDLMESINKNKDVSYHSTL
jgi:hypothetical protein